MSETVSLSRGALVFVTATADLDMIENDTQSGIQDFYSRLQKNWLLSLEALADELYETYTSDDDRHKRFRHRPKRAFLTLTKREEENAAIIKVTSKTPLCAAAEEHRWEIHGRHALLTSVEIGGYEEY